MSLKDILSKVKIPKKDTKKPEQKQILNYFKPTETDCGCGCEENITSEMLSKINEIRHDWGKPITIVSGRRCMKHTEALRKKGIPAALKSAHLEGLAVDVLRTDELLEFITANLEKYNIWMENPEFTPSWIHIQIRPVKGKRVFNP